MKRTGKGDKWREQGNGTEEGDVKGGLGEGV